MNNISFTWKELYFVLVSLIYRETKQKLINFWKKCWKNVLRLGICFYSAQLSLWKFLHLALPCPRHQCPSSHFQPFAFFSVFYVYAFHVFFQACAFFELCLVFVPIWNTKRYIRKVFQNTIESGISKIL